MKAKLNKYLLPLLTAFTLLFASCSDISDDSDTDRNSGSEVTNQINETPIKLPEGAQAAIRIALATNSARTALPVLAEESNDGLNESQLNKYSWELKGYRYETSDYSESAETLGDWSLGSNAEATPYTTMCSTDIGMDAGKWKLVLTATKKSDTDTVSTYSATVENIDISAGIRETPVSFAMKLVSINTNPTVAGNGDVKITVNWTSSDVDKVTGQLYELPSGSELTTAVTIGANSDSTLQTITSNGGTYTMSGVACGKKVALFVFYDAKDNILGKWREYVNIVNDSVSVGSVNVESLDDVYTITYLPVPDMLTAHASALKASFTRHNEAIALPMAYQIDESKDGVFGGWFLDENYTQRIDSITPSAKNSRKDFVVYGLFYDKSDKPAISVVTSFTGKVNGVENSEPRVGNTLKASVTEDETTTAFEGSCRYQWEYQLPSSDSWTAISGATASTYKITNDMVDNKLRVGVKKLYKFTPSYVTGESGDVKYYTREENSAYKYSAPVGAIQPGVINSLSGITIQYSGKVLVGKKPQKANLILSGVLSDEYGNTIRDYSSDFTDAVSALTVSTSVPVKITVDGYSAGEAGNTITGSVLVYVQNNIPDATKILLSTDKVNISTGKIKFNVNAEYTENLEYAVGEDPTSWDALTSDEFNKPDYLWVRVKGSGTAGTVGSVYASEAISVPITSSNIGTKTDGSGSGGNANIEYVVELLSGSEINTLFTSNFKTATSFAYVDEIAPSSAITISKTGTTTDSTDNTKTISYIEAKAWVSVSNRKIYVNATGYDGTNSKIKLPTDCSGMFSGMTKLKTVDLSGFDSSKVVKMSNLFKGCSALTSVIFGNTFDVKEVTHMNSMFENTAIESIDLSKFVFDTSGSVLKDISSMFAGTALVTLDLSVFDTQLVENMASLLDGCTELETVSLGNKFVTTHVEDMSAMFRDCVLLEDLDVSTFATGNVSDMSYMFAGLESLQSIDLSVFVVTKVLNVDYMFSGDFALNKIYVATSADWYTTIQNAATNAETTASGTGMFANCGSLVGGSGHGWTNTKTSYKYARVDGSNDSTMGYFTAK